MIINNEINGDVLRHRPLSEAAPHHVLHPENPGGVGRVTFASRAPQVNIVAHLSELEEDPTGVWPRIAFLHQQCALDIEEDVHVASLYPALQRALHQPPLLLANIHHKASYFG